MIYDEDAKRNGWVISETRPEYARKTFVFKINNCTVTATVNRPILSPTEQKKREEQVATDLSYVLRNYVARKEKEAASLKPKD